MKLEGQKFFVAAVALLLAVATGDQLAKGQAPATTPPANGQQQQQPDQSGPDSGGPGGDNGAIAIPKK